MFLRLACVVACACACARGECGEAHAQLTVATLRNASGHWEARVRLYQEAAPPARLQPLLVDVRLASSLCGPLRSHLLTVTLSGPPLVPPGYTELSGLGFYRLYEETITWPEAKSACEAEGAHLLVLNSEAEATAIQKLIQRHPSVTPWIHIGFHDKIKEGHYVTIFGETLTEAGYTRWDAGQPDNLGNEDCGSINAKTVGLNDLNCATHKFAFICEQNFR
ncbi:hypothetical protein R5R35_006222 [Gryllus longicercus]|uniref:C-type lectin domain-containing protein n=1 Tax=Gryllus longicercus TaxID=2509291 RepID=A0AAN9W1D8_9ORTH